MFAYLKFSLRLAKLERKKDRLDEEYEVRIENARKRGISEDEMQKLQGEAMNVWYNLEEEIKKLHSNYLVRQAHRLLISLPQDAMGGRVWESDENGLHYLNERGIMRLRADIRAERKARVELFLMWMPGAVVRSALQTASKRNAIAAFSSGIAAIASVVSVLAQMGK